MWLAHHDVTFRRAPRFKYGADASAQAFETSVLRLCQCFGGLIGIEGIGIEVVSDPLGEFGMAFVFGVADCLEELGVAPGAADVFRRTTSDSLDQARIDDARHGIG